MFSTNVLTFWANEFTQGEQIIQQENFSLYADSLLDEDYQMMRLYNENEDIFCCCPALLQQLNLVKDSNISRDNLLNTLSSNQLIWHGADQIFYLPENTKKELTEYVFDRNLVRPLNKNNPDDQAAFDLFYSQNSAEDIDCAYVEFDHDTVYSVFIDNKIVAAASMYEWEHPLIMDMGVLTLPDFRQLGYAKLLIKALSQHVIKLGFEPQYRSQLDNTSSLLLAQSAGYNAFAQWDVIFK